MRARRNNAPSGLLMLAGAILVGGSALAPWATVTGPSVGFNAGGFHLDLANVPTYDLGDGADVAAAVVGCAVAVGLLAAALTATRVRILGPLWRVAALVAVAFPALVAVDLWHAVGSDPAEVVDAAHASVADRIAAEVGSLLQHTGVLHLGPGPGLWMLSAGAVLVLFAVVVPAIRRRPVEPSVLPVPLPFAVAAPPHPGPADATPPPLPAPASPAT